MSDRIGSTTIVAIFGGLASDATGGDFYEGAMSAAFVHLYNDLSKPITDKYGQTNYNRSEKLKPNRKYNSTLNIDESKRVYGKNGSWYQRYRDDGTAMSGWGGQVDFQYYNGRSPAERFVYGGAKFAQIMIRDHGDGLGLTLSVGAAVTSGGTSIFLGISAIGIDMLQQDPWGTGIGVGSIFMKSLAPVDIVYGIGQL